VACERPPHNYSLVPPTVNYYLVEIIGFREWKSRRKLPSYFFSFPDVSAKVF